MNYVTVTIRLPKEDYLRLKTEAKMRGMSFSAVVREIICKPSKVRKKESEALS